MPRIMPIRLSPAYLVETRYQTTSLTSSTTMRWTSESPQHSGLAHTVPRNSQRDHSPALGGKRMLSLMKTMSGVACQRLHRMLISGRLTSKVACLPRVLLRSHKRSNVWCGCRIQVQILRQVWPAMCPSTQKLGVRGECQMQVAGVNAWTVRTKQQYRANGVCAASLHILRQASPWQPWTCNDSKMFWTSWSWRCPWLSVKMLRLACRTSSPAWQQAKSSRQFSKSCLALWMQPPLVTGLQLNKRRPGWQHIIGSSIRAGLLLCGACLSRLQFTSARQNLYS
mmetsp:Transcript_42475/g.76327  ORF Transcript_42475/g.76327 Transcript_42475/m.76327 type:complete len:282 (-) Transcript_42475:96-941(-)